MKHFGLAILATFSTLSFAQTTFTFKSDKFVENAPNKNIRIEKSYSVAVPIRIGNTVETSYYGVNFVYDLNEMGSVDDGGDDLYGYIKLTCKDIPVISDSSMPRRYQDMPVLGMNREDCIKMHLQMKEFKVRRIQGPISSTDIDRNAFCTKITIEHQKGKATQAEVVKFEMIEDQGRIKEYQGLNKPQGHKSCAE